MKNIWFDESVVKNSKSPPWIKEGRKWMRKNVGKPCACYAPKCVSCELWMHFIQLEITLDEQS